ncbi:antibiotic biosynthesis monooxygenase family protein [Paraflavitalea pollutisoli]|uniref:antibiotic biosynthesis monooxygenase family protein n=1 Tax=Paraflavitalea pollutisoli TaxID=3034143 RepID=UPI0023ED1E22|nr:antibiotic biosynthesis monooxygenase [Paraflavitalea sp. H1-2-19X]
MIAVIFEVIPKADQLPQYLAIAESIKPFLSTIEGFISVERFQSLSEPRKYLSLSYWRDEAAVAQWRNLAEHRVAQQEGRSHVFEDYSIRIAAVVRDYGMQERQEAPTDSRAFHRRAGPASN